MAAPGLRLLWTLSDGPAVGLCLRLGGRRIRERDATRTPGVEQDAFAFFAFDVVDARSPLARGAFGKIDGARPPGGGDRATTAAETGC